MGWLTRATGSGYEAPGWTKTSTGSAVFVARLALGTRSGGATGAPQVVPAGAYNGFTSPATFDGGEANVDGGNSVIARAFGRAIMRKARRTAGLSTFGSSTTVAGGATERLRVTRPPSAGGTPALL